MQRRESNEHCRPRDSDGIIPKTKDVSSRASEVVFPRGEKIWVSTCKRPPDGQTPVDRYFPALSAQMRRQELLSRHLMLYSAMYTRDEQCELYSHALLVGVWRRDGLTLSIDRHTNCDCVALLRKATMNSATLEMQLERHVAIHCTGRVAVLLGAVAASFACHSALSCAFATEDRR